MSERVKRIFYCSRCGRYSLNLRPYGLLSLKPYVLGKEWLCSFCFANIIDERYYIRNFGVKNESKTKLKGVITIKDRLKASIFMCPVCKNQFEKTISQHKRVYCSEDCKYLARKIRKELKLRKEDLDLEGNLNLKLKR